MTSLLLGDVYQGPALHLFRLEPPHPTCLLRATTLNQGEDKIEYWNTRDEVETTEGPKEDTSAKGHGTTEGTVAIYFSIYDASAASYVPRPSTKVTNRVVWNNVG